MMMSPESYVSHLKDKSYEECLKERDSLIRNIRRYEKGKYDDEEKLCRCPSPSVIYQCELEYLSELCKLILEKYQLLERDCVTIEY